MFFGRPKVKGTVEVINDINSMVANFWKQLKDNNEELHRVLGNTFYSREDFEECREIYKGKKIASDIEKARAFFVCCNCSFIGGITNGWHINPRGLGGTRPIKIFHKAKSIEFLKQKMKNVYIENGNALKVIKTWDSDVAFFYIDPPYPDASQGPYGGYTMKDFNKLTEVLKKIKGRFILSCYLKDGMKIDSKWKTEKRKTLCTAARVTIGQNKPRREECLIMNC